MKPPTPDASAQPLPTDPALGTLHALELSFRYPGRDTPTLTGIDLEIGPGELVLLTGSTGSGKSTLLKCLAGVIPHLSSGSLAGRVLVDGLDTRDTPPRALSRHLGMVLQSPDSQLTATRVEDEIAFGLENLRMPRAEIGPRIAWALDQVGLSGRRSDEVRVLSGGQKQRLVIAAALAMGPRILLLDEPISQLDPRGARDILELLRALKSAQGLTVVLIEHRLEEVAPLADRVIVMDEGRIALNAPAQEAWRRLELFHRLGLVAPTVPELFERLGRLERPVTVEGGVALLKGKRLHPAEEWPGGGDPAGGGAPVSLFPPAPPPGKPPLLEVANLHYRYLRKAPEVLRGIDLKVLAGERVAILGANGSGKSTLLGCLAGVFPGFSGHVRLAGRPVRKALREVGLMFQDPDLMLLTDSVREELAFAPYHRGLEPAGIQARVDEALGFLHLEALSHEPPLGLSRGQRLRVAVASVLSAHPRLLLLDEPTTGQDRLHIETLMDGLAGHPDLEALMFCTHDVGTALRYATRVLVMAGGRIVADGEPRAVLADRQALDLGELIVPPARALAEALDLPAFTLDELVDALKGGGMRMESSRPAT